jgi:hypothetical protein
MLTFLVLQIAGDNGADISRVTHGVDYLGRICGVSEGVEDKPVGAWPYPLEYGFIVCLEKCNRTMYSNENPGVTSNLERIDDVMDPNFVIPYPTVEVFGFCIPDAIALADYGGFNMSSIAFSDTTPTYSTTAAETSDSFFDFGGDFGSFGASASKAMSSLAQASDIILASFVIAVAMSFFVVWGVAKCVKPIILSLIFLIAFILFGLGYYVYDYGVNWEDNGLDEKDGESTVILGYVILGIDALFLIVMFFLRHAIDTAFNVIQMSSDAFQRMKSLIFVPLVCACILFGYFAFWLWGAAYIYSVKTYNYTDTPTELKYYFLAEDDFFRNDNPDKYNSTSFDSSMQMAAAWHFFHLLWVNQFLIYFTYLVFCGATADWYFTENDEDGNLKIGSGDDEFSAWPILASIKRTLLHHIGTVALTSLIIAIIQFIRAVVHYIENKVGGKKNKLQEYIFKCIHCCLACAECCMDKINKNALIWTAIFGDSFAPAACGSFRLIMAHLEKVAAINIITGMVINMSKLFCGGLTCLIGILLIQNVEPYASDVNSIYMPGVVMFLIGFYIGTAFLAIQHALIDCIFLCYLVDMDKNPKGRRYANRDDAKKKKQNPNAKTFEEEIEAGTEGHDKSTVHENLTVSKYKDPNYEPATGCCGCGHRKSKQVQPTE